MCLDSFTESILRSFLEIPSSTSMDVDVYESRHHIHTLDIHEFCTDYRQVAIRDFQDLVVSQYDAPFLEPSLWGKYLTIDNLS